MWLVSDYFRGRVSEEGLNAVLGDESMRSFVGFILLLWSYRAGYFEDGADKLGVSLFHPSHYCMTSLGL